MKKKQYEKNFIRQQEIKRTNVSHDISQEVVMYAMIGIIILFMSLLAYGKTDYDLNNIDERKISTQQSTSNLDLDKPSNS